jgi:uncharacterized protein
MDKNRCVLVFIKFPEKGKVKSRLSPAFDTDMVLSLYECFVFDLLETLRKGMYSLKICFYPPDAYETIVSWIGKGYAYLPQRGNDLGERMKNAFLDAFSEEFSEVVLIGSDIPDLTVRVLHEAFAFDLYDASIGPAFDGGYYLIGFQRKTFLPEIFQGIKWGTDTVLKQTMDQLKNSQHTVRVLPVRNDIDRPEDVHDLYARNRNTEFAASRTMRFLSENLRKYFKEIPPLLPLNHGQKR